MKHLLILNDPPYGIRHAIPRLRMAHALTKHDLKCEVNVFQVWSGRR